MYGVTLGARATIDSKSSDSICWINRGWADCTIACFVQCIATTEDIELDTVETGESQWGNPSSLASPSYCAGKHF